MGLGAAGVLHTSGKTMLWPVLPLWAIPRPLVKVVCDIISSCAYQYRRPLTMIRRAVHQARGVPVTLSDSRYRQRDKQRPARRPGVPERIGGMVHATLGVERRPVAQKCDTPLLRPVTFSVHGRIHLANGFAQAVA